jgi:hypothetical protein
MISKRWTQAEAAGRWPKNNSIIADTLRVQASGELPKAVNKN